MDSKLVKFPNLYGFYERINQSSSMIVEGDKKNRAISLGEKIYYIGIMSLFSIKDEHLDAGKVLGIALMRALSINNGSNGKSLEYIKNKIYIDSLFEMVKNNEYFYELWTEYIQGGSPEAKHVKKTMEQISNGVLDVNLEAVSDSAKKIMSTPVSLWNKLGVNKFIFRIESWAEHIINSALLGLAICQNEGYESIDKSKFLQMIFLYKLADIEYHSSSDESEKYLGRQLSGEKVLFLSDKIKNIWYESEYGDSLEMKFAKDVEKIAKDFQATYYANNSSNKELGEILMVTRTKFGKSEVDY